MKTLILLSIGFTMAFFEDAHGKQVVDQVCTGDVTLSSQAEVDAFNCTEVTGRLVISGPDIINLNTLSSLRKVGGNLSISDNPNLETLDLPALETLNGGLSIENNPALLTVTGFSSLVYAGSISIGGNPKLVSISGFNSLQRVSLLQDMGGLPYGGFGIGSNDALTNIEGFGALRHTGNFRIGRNRSLLALDGFPALEGVTGEFSISNNESLKTINGFNKFRSITGIPRLITTVSLLIQNNASLESLDGLSSLNFMSGPVQAWPPSSGTVVVNITGNPKLTQCCSLRNLLDVLLGDSSGLPQTVLINISENGGGCTREDILNCEKICNGDVTLTSQAEVDAFNCTEVTGSLVISGNDITNLNTLSSLRTVGGNLSISDIPNLEIIDLPDISVRSLSISNNANLKSISGFNNTKFASSIDIGGNPKLGSISGFDSLVQVEDIFGGLFAIGQNNALTHLPAFGALKTAGNFRIVNNAKLLALDGFPSLTLVIGVFQISNNESLKTINGYNKLRSISGVPRTVPNSALLIENNASLETLDGLSSLKSISAPVQQTGGGPVPGFVDVRVNGNPKLTQCCTLRTLLDGLVAAGAPSPFIRINISGNGGGCDYEDILKCEKICDGDVTLTSQAEVDAFNCTKVTGNLTVTGADITSLNGLSSLREVYGHLRIENVNAPSLEGLSLLDSIGGAFLVINNPSLYGIGGSFSVQEGIEISYNSNLLLISGFNSIKKLFWLGIQNNPKLTSVAGFDSVEIIQTATPSPFAPTGIGISNNGALITIPDFQMLSRVGQITITGNNQLPSLDGFSNVSRIEGVLTISDNSSLKVINAFENLVSIVGISRHIPRGGLMIENNPLLEGFPGLSSLKEIKSDQSADLSIINNASLKNIDGLSSLTTFFALHADKTLSIRNNAILENIDGLSSLVDVIQGEGDTYINITGNPMLTQCCGLQPLIDALSFSGTIPPSVHIDISQNGGGCTLDDILACGSQRILGFTLLNHQTKAVIQHFQNEMTIDLADPRFSHLMLQANTSPQQVGSVEFNFDGHIRRTENGFPYQFILPQFTPGIHTTRADVYSEHQLKGEKGISRVATFNVINSATVISFDVVNQARQTLMTLHDGDKINIQDPAFKTFLFRANTVPDRVSKVELFLNNQLVAVERGFPYEVYGNRTPGDYTLEAIPYIKINVRGNEYVPGTSLKISFKVVSEDPGSTSQLVMNDQSNDESLLKIGEDAGVTIFPVPVDSELYLKIDDAAGKDPLITIRTIHGLTIYQGSYSKSQSINTLQLQAGVYYLQVAGYGGFQKVVKFIKK